MEGPLSGHPTRSQNAGALADTAEDLASYLTTIGSVGKRIERWGLVLTASLLFLFFGFILPSFGLEHEIHRVRSDLDLTQVRIESHRQKAQAFEGSRVNGRHPDRAFRAIEA